MRIAIANDHAGVEYKWLIAKMLEQEGHTVINFGTDLNESCDYPDYAEKVALAVSSGQAERGILICGSGVGMSIAANKFKGIRASLCTDEYTAEMTRLHNDANVICMGARVTGSCLALDILDAFLENGYEGGRHAIRVGMMADIEESQK